MIHDAKIEVTCDCDCCHDSIDIELPWKYTDYSGNNGYYDSNENDIASSLVSHGWIVKGDKHFCNEDCVK